MVRSLLHASTGVLLAVIGLAPVPAIAQPGKTTPSSDRTAPLPGLIPAPTPLPRNRRWQMLTRNLIAQVGNVTFSPDDRWFTVACGHAVRMYDLNGEMDVQRALLGHTGLINAVRYSPNGKLLATASHDGTVRIWDPEGVEKFVYSQHEDGVKDVCWHPDGKRLASASLDGTVRIWSLDGKTLSVLTAHEAPVHAVAWSLDGKRLASGCANRTIRLWTPEGEPGPVLEGHLGQIQSLAWNADSSMLLSGDSGIDAADQSKENLAHLKVWDAGGKLLQTASVPNPIFHVCWNPEGTQGLAGGYASVWLWPIADQKPVQRIGGGGPFTPVAWRPSGSAIATGTQIRTIAGETIRRIPQRLATVVALEQNPAGDRLAVACTDGFLYLFDREGNLLHRSEAAIQRTMAPTGLRWSSDGASILFGPRFSSEIQRYDTDAVKLGEPIPLIARGTCAFDWSRDGRYVVTGGDAQIVQLVDLETATVTALGRQAHGITGVRFTPDEKQVCSVGFDGCIRFWTRDGKADHVFEAIAAPIRSIDWSGDGQLLATGHEDNTIRFWNSDGVAAKVIGGHGGFVQTLDFSPDSQSLASGSWDHTVRIWKRDGTPVAVLRGHEGNVFAVQWTRDGRRILSGAADGILRLWDPATGQAEWQTLFGDAGDSVTVDSRGQVKQGNEQLLETDFVFFVEDDQGRLVRTPWAELRDMLPPAITPKKAP